MSKSVNYVREKKIPALLNDMVVHLLSTKASDVIESLIQYLEKHPDAAGHQTKPKTAAPAPQHAAAADQHHAQPAAADSHNKNHAAAADSSHHNSAAPAHNNAQTEIAHKPAPPPAEHATGRPHPALHKHEEAPLPTPAEVGKNAQTLLDELMSSEKELAHLLTKVMDADHIPQELRTLAATASSNNAELLKVTHMSDFALTQVDIALERVKSEMTDTEFYASKGFRLLHEIDTDERKLRSFFKHIDVTSLRHDEAELATQAIRMHDEFLHLVDTIEEHQLRIAVKANGGAVNHSVATYFSNLSEELGQTCMDLRANTASLKSRVPPEAVKSLDAKKAGPKAKSLTSQTNSLVNSIKEYESNFLKTLSALQTGNDVELQALVADAIRNSKEMEAIAAEVATTTNDVSTGGDNPHMSYDDLRIKIHGMNDRVSVKMILVHKAHSSAIARVTASLTAQAKVDATAMTKTLHDTLAKHEHDPHVKEALAAQREVETLVSEIDALQQAISSHTAGH